jgi:hypothetical protein
MRIGVMSDTHGHLATARRAIKDMGNVDVLVHLGDYYHDAVLLSAELQREIISVKGNCDFSSSIPAEQIIETEGLRIYATHGHQHGVKWDHDGIIEKARDLKADVVLFGHSHVAEIFADNGILFINPGSIGEPRGSDTPSYAIIEIRNGKAYPYIVFLSL